MRKAHTLHKWQHVLKCLCKEIRTDPSRQRELEYALTASVSFSEAQRTLQKVQCGVQVSELVHIFRLYNLRVWL